MTAVTWNDGRLITLNGGDTASCNGNLNQGQLYALVFYNSAGNDANATVNVIWSQSQPPVKVSVPGTTGNQGLAALCFVSGSDTASVSISLTTADPGVKIDAYIASVKMPTNTSGINNVGAPIGSTASFTKFTRFYGVPASHWYDVTLKSNINQFISVQLTENKANVVILNQQADPSNTIAYTGTTQSQVTVTGKTYNTYEYPIQGNGTQWVWVNADSAQNSQTATLAIQSLQATYNLFAKQKEDA
ncbi:hypothetical protein Rleg10DRAFT_7156 [Rhizobium leguminosarum bv. trifolii WSM2012]|nr:hypothetical protein Rleg10DRAFT_7156 [Rhizobium leguminosarum bv. trifolii WSM2012]